MVFTRESAAALIKFFYLLVRHLFEGGAYLGVALTCTIMYLKLPTCK